MNVLKKKMSKSNKESSGSYLDNVLIEIGDFGKYQAFVFVLVSIVLSFYAAIRITFVFTSIDLNYR